jgi:hypothetical protein
MRTFRIKRDGWWVLRDILQSNEPFKTAGSMRGEPDVYPSQGRMPADEYDSMRARAVRAGSVGGRVDYAVWSYGTIIGYRVEDVWYVPDVKYSITTTIQQNKLRVAVDA